MSGTQANWIIRLLAGSMIAGSLAWGSMITKGVISQEVKVQNLQDQFARIEGKLDRILYNTDDKEVMDRLDLLIAQQAAVRAAPRRTAPKYPAVDMEDDRRNPTR